LTRQLQKQSNSWTEKQNVHREREADRSLRERQLRQARIEN